MLKRCLVALVLCFALSLGAAQANVNFTTKADLKAKGIPVERLHVSSFSPDGRSVIAYMRNSDKEIAKGFVCTAFLITADRDNKVGKVRSYPLNMPEWEQASFTPDGKAVIIITKSGASFYKLDLATGETSVVMEHVKGQPGFRSYPQIIQVVRGQLLCLGYFYDAEDFAGTNSTAILDPNKTGVDAFTLCNSTQKVQYQLKGQNEAFPMADLGYIGVARGNNYKFYVWKPSFEKPVLFDEGVKAIGFWGSDARLLYSMEKGKNAYDLSIYDADKSEKINVAQGTSFPYRYVFLSSDGKTALFSEIDVLTDRGKIFYARESEGWKVKPVKGLENSLNTGAMRISPDGKLGVLQTETGIRFFDVEGE